MAQQAKDPKKVSRIKGKKKLWFRILASKLFGMKELGESFLTNADAAKGRTLLINLRDLTGNMRDQNAYIRFKITSTEGSALHTSIIGYELTPSFVKRLVRKDTERLDDNFTCVTKDGKELLFKTLMITAFSEPRSVEGQLRAQLKTIVYEEVRNAVYDTVITDVVGQRLQGMLRKRLGKITPVKDVSIRVMKLLGEKEVSPQAEEVQMQENEESSTEEPLEEENAENEEEAGEPAAEEAEEPLTA